MVMAIVVIVVATALAAAMVQMALAQRLQFETERRRVQAEWYAQAGLDRAAVAAEKSKDYTGEEWTIAESSTRSAQIQITVDRDAEPARLTVAVEYPVGELHRARCRRELTLVSPRGATAVSALQPENRLP
jgi:type II secretory pathway component PulK